jgi:hypothetical protein
MHQTKITMGDRRYKFALLQVDEVMNKRMWSHSSMMPQTRSVIKDDTLEFPVQRTGIFPSFSKKDVYFKRTRTLLKIWKKKIRTILMRFSNFNPSITSRNLFIQSISLTSRSTIAVWKQTSLHRNRKFRKLVEHRSPEVTLSSSECNSGSVTD